MRSPQTPSLTRSPSTWGRKCVTASFNQCRISRRRSFDNAFAAFAIVILPISQLPMYGDYTMLPEWMRGAVSDQERSCVTAKQTVFDEITKCDIEAVFRAIRVHVRRTPVIEICGREFGL